MRSGGGLVAACLVCHSPLLITNMHYKIGPVCFFGSSAQSSLRGGFATVNAEGKKKIKCHRSASWGGFSFPAAKCCRKSWVRPPCIHPLTQSGAAVCAEPPAPLPGLAVCKLELPCWQSASAASAASAPRGHACAASPSFPQVYFLLASGDGCGIEKENSNKNIGEWMGFLVFLYFCFSLCLGLEGLGALWGPSAVPGQAGLGAAMDGSGWEWGWWSLR